MNFCVCCGQTLEQSLPVVDNSNFDDLETFQLVDRVLRRDDKDEFVELVNSCSREELEDVLVWIYINMYQHDSAKCAAAVLDGETKIPDVITFMSGSLGANPLHASASFMAMRITTLLLKRGFSADVRCDWEFTEENTSPQVLPLGIYLSQVRILLSHYLDERTSAVHFTITLFRNLTTSMLRLLAENTRDVKHEFFNYLKEGKMVEVGALLLAATPLILSSSTVKGEFRNIPEMRDFLLDEMLSYINTKRPLSACDNKLIQMQETLVLLQIFDTIGDKLAALSRQDFRHESDHFQILAAASLLQDAGFEVKPEYVYCDSFTRGKLFKNCVLEKRPDDCKKTAFTTYALPSWLKGGALGIVADRSISSSCHTYPLLSKINFPSMSTVASTSSMINFPSMSTVASTSSMPEIKPLQHLLKQSSSILGTLKRVFRRG